MIDDQTIRPQKDFAGPTIHPPSPRTPNRSRLLSCAALGLLAVTFGPASAQQVLTPQTSAPVAAAQALVATAPVPSDSAIVPADPSDALPDDPSALLVASSDSISPLSTGDNPQAPGQAQRRAQRSASIHMKYIPPGWATVHPLPARDKVLLGLRDTYNVRNLSTIVIAAGYSHLLDGQPNYGANSEAFAKRLGAAAIRDTTEGVFTDAIFAPLLHEDPRYYIEGPQYSFMHRTLYAITRPLVTRTDSGRSSINASLLLGYAAASALSYTYYPQINRNFHDTAATFGGGIGGAALGFAVTEFASDVLQKLHLARPQ